MDIDVNLILAKEFPNTIKTIYKNGLSINDVIFKIVTDSSSSHYWLSFESKENNNGSIDRS